MHFLQIVIVGNELIISSVGEVSAVLYTVKSWTRTAAVGTCDAAGC